MKIRLSLLQRCVTHTFSPANKCIGPAWLHALAGCCCVHMNLPLQHALLLHRGAQNCLVLKKDVSKPWTSSSTSCKQSWQTCRHACVLPACRSRHADGGQVVFLLVAGHALGESCRRYCHRR